MKIHPASTLLAVLLIGSAAAADKPKAKKEDGHDSALSVTIEFREKGAKARGGILVGTTYDKSPGFYSPFQFAYADTGTTAATLWLDTIQTMSDTSETGLTVTMKDGKKRSVKFGEKGHRYLILALPDGGQEVIALDEVKAVQFLRPARKDADGNAMFDHWTFSPFTGEKLPAVAESKKK